MDCRKLSLIGVYMYVIPCCTFQAEYVFLIIQLVLHSSARRKQICLPQMSEEHI